VDSSGQLVAGRKEATLGGEAAGRATTALAHRQAREEDARVLKLQRRAMLSHDGLLLSGPRGTRFEVPKCVLESVGMLDVDFLLIFLRLHCLLPFLTVQFD